MAAPNANDSRDATMDGYHKELAFRLRADRNRQRVIDTGNRCLRGFRPRRLSALAIRMAGAKQRIPLGHRSTARLSTYRYSDTSAQVSQFDHLPQSPPHPQHPVALPDRGPLRQTAPDIRCEAAADLLSTDRDTQQLSIVHREPLDDDNCLTAPLYTQLLRMALHN